MKIQVSVLVAQQEWDIIVHFFKGNRFSGRSRVFDVIAGDDIKKIGRFQLFKRDAENFSGKGFASIISYWLLKRTIPSIDPLNTFLNFNSLSRNSCSIRFLSLTFLKMVKSWLSNIIRFDVNSSSLYCPFAIRNSSSARISLFDRTAFEWHDTADRFDL